VAPGQLAHGLWANFAVRPTGRELTHVLQVRVREALHLWELRTKIRREPLDDSPTPTLLLLALEDLAADTPVEPDQLLIDRECGPRARSTDLSLEARKQLGIAVRKGGSGKSLTADHCLHYRNVAGRLPSTRHRLALAVEARPASGSAATRAALPYGQADPHIRPRSQSPTWTASSAQAPTSLASSTSRSTRR
jgi:hypothetical protein